MDTTVTSMTTEQTAEPTTTRKWTWDVTDACGGAWHADE